MNRGEISMKVEKNKEYRIKGKSPYFKGKYGTANPNITIEDKDTALWSRGWGMQDGNPACMLFGMRSGMEGLPWGGVVYYGKIGGFGELVHETELEEVA